ncbi:MAG: TIGR00153 family protein [Gammaproteobacteria bacterium]|nr:TIGR00153 family protein [Gammaproteobacteria bacterium]
MATKNMLASVFGRSPVRPLQQHMGKVAACANELGSFFEAVSAGDWAKADEARSRVKLLEDEADAMKTEIRLNLPKSLFMPVARADLLDLVRVQDKIANKAKDITGLMKGRKMVLPESLRDLFNSYVAQSVAAVHQADKTVNELDELFESGFGGKEADIVEGMIRELDAVEKETDKLQVELRRKLFELEDTLKPVDVMFLYRIIDWIGDVADHAQRVGARLHLLLAR